MRKPYSFVVAVSLFLFVLLLVNERTVVAQSRTIELEIYVDDRAPLGTAQDWVEMLNNCGADRVSLKTGFLRTPSAEETKLQRSTAILVKGTVDRNRLFLPGGTFTINDRARISAHLKQLREDGTEVALADKMAFGLTAPQLVELHQLLSKPVDFSTKGANIKQSLQQVSKLIGQSFQIDSDTAEKLMSNDTIAEELQGISAGTAIAIMIRPLGLVMQPERQSGQPVKLAIVDSQSSKEHWPIGWPPEELPLRVVPKMFERLDLEIRGFPLQGTLDAIEKRTEVKFIYDHNGLAKAGIEMSEVKVNLVQKKVSYMAALGKLLRQTKPGSIHELRLDEAGKPFLWISTMR